MSAIPEACRDWGQTKGAYRFFGNERVESAAILAPHIRKPREAKKALANRFAALGRVRVAGDEIHVTLVPVGRDDERKAFPVLCTELALRDPVHSCLASLSSQARLSFKNMLVS